MFMKGVPEESPSWQANYSGFAQTEKLNICLDVNATDDWPTTSLSAQFSHLQYIQGVGVLTS